jgi:hypothetical protein
VVDPASPYTVAAGVNNVTFASSKTLAPRALSNYVDGQSIVVTNSSASTITVTITPADGTIDGSASVALTVLAHGVVGCQRTSSTTWVSLQPGALTPNGVHGYVSGGSFYAVAANINNGVITDIGTAIVPTSTNDPSGIGCTTSGANVSVPFGAASSGAMQTTAQYWSWTLSSLGITLPSGAYRIRFRTWVSSFTEGARSTSGMAVLLGLGTSATTNSKALGIYRPVSGTAWSYAGANTSSAVLNATGGTTTVDIRGTALIGSTSTTDFFVDRYGASNAYEASGTFGGGAGLAATPTSATIYCQRAGVGSSTTNWTLNGFQFFFWYSGF